MRLSLLPIVYSEFDLVHGRTWWTHARAAALESGVSICETPPSVSVAVLWRGQYAGSVGAIEHEGLLMYEWLVLNGRLPATVRWAAAQRLMVAGMDYAAARGARLTMVVDKRRGAAGIRAIAKRLGFAVRSEHLEVLEGGSDDREK
jgi:hypothetical protein